jgi:putative membrane-bound dehydrogenase-like protein
MNSSRLFPALASLSLCPLIPAADLKPDATTEIPDSARREIVIQLKPSQISNFKSQIPRAEIPAGYELQVVAAAPLAMHPIMGCLDDRGRLFVGDATGVNWNKKQLEANPPNRILLLEDTDGDGVYDRSTVFADKLTFPQGGCWLNGSLYVCSPPGLWKFTDTDGDGVADQREQIVTGFEYTGNAADVHGPWLHPNGRLYWCHGRKGHKVIGKEGTVVHEGLACGIWSCKPDGSDVQWHALGCGDNPVKVDFTPDGDIIGVQNLYYSQPRGDTIVHWLYRGVYERADQMKAIEGLPRTLEHMPVMYNFGHVAVSGCCFWRGFTSANPDPRTLNLMVTHFNTQRLVRMELTPDGASFKARENEFLRLHDPDIHLTDVMEAPDGSLLVTNTGGWFRIGCPASLMAKPDVTGAVYRI